MTASVRGFLASRHFCRPIARFYKVILAISALGAVAGGVLTSRIGLDTDLAALLPDSFLSVQALRRMEDEVAGGTSSLRVAIKSEDYGALVRLADDLAAALSASEFVGSVDYQSDVEFYERNALLFLDTLSLDSLHFAIQDAIDAEKQALNPFMIDDLFGPPPSEVESESDELARWEEEYEGDVPSRYYLNPDSTVLVLSAQPARPGANLAYSRSMVQDARRIVEETNVTSYASDMEVFYGSNIKNRIDEYETIRSDIFGTALYGLGGVFLMLVLVFRGVLIPLMVSAALASSLMWTFGVTYLVIGQLNTITGFLFVVLFGMGVDYGIHAMARYRESRQAGLDPDGALDRMVCKTGRALGATALTTSAAFFSLMFLDFKGFSELGFISGMGMIFAFLAMVVTLPAMVVLFERLGWLGIPEIPGKTLSSDRRPFPFATATVALSGVLVLGSVFYFSNVGFLYDFTDLRIITDEREEYGRETTGVFTRSESPAIVLADTRQDLIEVVAAVEEIIRSDTLSPTVASVSSILDVVPTHQERRLDRIRETRALVDEEAQGVLAGEDARRVDRLREYLAVDETFGWDDFPENDRQRFMNRDGEPGNFVLIYPSVPLRDGRNAIAFQEDIGTIVTDSGKEFYAGSDNLIVADMLTMITREGPIAVLLATGVVFLIILGSVRSVTATLLVLVPLLVGIAWMGGAMYFVGMELNFFNVVVFPSLVGIGVDDGIHIYHRYREEGPGSLPFVVRRTGVAVCVTTVTTMIGYSGLVLASHPGLESIGLLAQIGLLATLLSAVVVLPALLEVVGPGARQEAPSVPATEAVG